ncbi:hypothetical protein N7537_008865 [Penicillium hordei]|uniref:Uncharacterized protein n=1 Tax=Penicillium hordei TaxID=40994 RepID=A0AAD6E163_9EURO|nr:uncharacterized protein N7537_008865 [Penicillium hordei]KAJ5598781.1 hypothetical protein N7537_008865 [Penicillium hordei]
MGVDNTSESVARDLPKATLEGGFARSIVSTPLNPLPEPRVRLPPPSGSRTSPATTAHAGSYRKEARRQLLPTGMHRHQAEAEAGSA